MSPLIVSPIPSIYRDDLFDRYHEPHRFYHNYDHISWMWSEYVQMYGYNHLANLMIIYHDSIYDPHRADNEEASVKLMYSHLGGYFSIDELEHVEDFIMSTKNHVKFAKEKIINDMDKIRAVLRDLDLAQMADPILFKINGDNIRKEYSHIPDYDFNQGRKRFFENVLKSKYIYSILVGYEEPTRKNIENWLKENQNV